jgi:hypothetical protein
VNYFSNKKPAEAGCELLLLTNHLPWYAALVAW